MNKKSLSVPGCANCKGCRFLKYSTSKSHSICTIDRNTNINKHHDVLSTGHQTLILQSHLHLDIISSSTLQIQRSNHPIHFIHQLYNSI